MGYGVRVRVGKGWKVGEGRGGKEGEEANLKDWFTLRVFPHHSVRELIAKALPSSGSQTRHSTHGKFENRLREN